MLNSLYYNRMRIKVAICAAGLTVCRLLFSCIFNDVPADSLGNVSFLCVLLTRWDSPGMLRLTLVVVEMAAANTFRGCEIVCDDRADTPTYNPTSTQ